MAHWKTAGWVADSDEEDADFALHAHPSSPTPKRSSESNASQAEHGRENDGRDGDSGEDELAAPAPASRVVKKVYFTKKAGPSSEYKQIPRLDVQKSTEHHVQISGQGENKTPVGVAIELETVGDGEQEGDDLEPTIPQPHVGDPGSVEKTHILSQEPQQPATEGRRSSISLAITSLEGTSPPRSLSSSPLSSPPDSPPPPAALATSSRHGWALRKRTAAQENPYTFEAVNYIRNMHDRGLKATVIRQPSSDIRQPEDEDDSQPFMPQSIPSSPHFAPSSPSETHFTPTGRINDDDDDDELPDVESILRARPGGLQRPLKRRKLGPVRNVSDQRRHFSAASIAQEKSKLRTPSHLDEDRVSASPSLAQTRKPKSARKADMGFQRPPTVPSVQLQTPAKTPEAEARVQVETFQSSSPDVMATSSARRKRTILVESDESEELDDETQLLDASNHQDEGQLVVTQRRIKGVLPASWARLDATKPQDSRNIAPARTQPFAKSSGPARGVARPISTRQRSPLKGSPAATGMIFSDDAPSSSPSQIALENGPLSDAQIVVQEDGTQAWPDSDDMEDVTVDFMMQAITSRKRSINAGTGAKSRKRLQQTKLSPHVRQGGGEHRAPRQKRRKRMDILTADQLSPRHPRPNFVKVARRTASARPGVRHLIPDRQAFRLHRESDNRDIEDVFRRCNGNESSEDENTRPLPLAEISGNTHANGNARVRKSSNKQGIAQEAQTRTTARRQSRKNAKMTRALETARQSIQLHTTEGFFTQHVHPTPLTHPAQLTTPTFDEQAPSTLRLGDPNPRPYVSISNGPIGKDTRIQANCTDAPVGFSFRPPRRRQRKKQPQKLEQYMSDDDGCDLTLADVGSNSLAESVLPELHSWSAGTDSVFGISQLPAGPLFEHSSFIGSGRFSNCLRDDNNDDCELSTQRRPWSETVRNEMSDKVHAIRDALLSVSAPAIKRKQALQDLENTASLIANDLYFLDPVDRKLLVQHGISFIAEVADAVAASESQSSSGTNVTRTNAGFRSQIAARLALIAYELVQESLCAAVSESLQKDCEKVLRTCLEESFTRIVRVGFAVLRKFLQPHSNWFPQPSEDGQFLAEDFVIVKVLCQSQQAKYGDIWSHFRSVGRFSISSLPNQIEDVKLSTSEQHWRDLFTVVPFLAIDRNGRVSWDCSDSGSDSNNWPFVKQLMNPILQAHLQDLTISLESFPAYCHALLARCFILIKDWRWRRSDAIIGFLFDVFAKKSLANLLNEECHYSADFLSHLSDSNELTVRSNDCCFHVLLKIIAVGIKALRTASQDKKVGDLVWRLVPNHDRRHPKDEDIHETDLDATRNHHDLLCTLYWAAPPTKRPPLKLIQSLVQDEGSHREAYRINVQAWLNLVRYQISCDSTRAALQPFVAWHDDLLDRLLRQHALARDEVEVSAQQSEARGLIIAHATKEKMIASNQREVEIVIKDLLHALGLATSLCPSPDSASVLMSPTLARVFDLFEPKCPRIYGVLEDAIAVIGKAMEADRVPCLHGTRTTVRDENEDSQGLDWTEIEDLVEIQKGHTEAVFNEELFSKLHLFVSSCFSAESPPPDSFLRRLIEVWARLVSLYVKRGVTGWENFLSRYGRNSWFNIIDTEQKRKYAPLFYTHLLRHEPVVWRNEKSLVLSTWLTSLADREALLSFQGDLTAELLNLNNDEPLLHNLPFCRDSSGKYNIKLEDLRQARIALLNSILSNMRVAASQNSLQTATTIDQRKHEYKDLLGPFMEALKLRYQELGSEHEFQSSYLKFVHPVLKAIQEQVLEICPLDPFFSSHGFPLPSDDPMYVASKLKAYRLRMSDPNIPKQLASFLGPVIERSIYDGRMGEVSQQLQTGVALEDHEHICPEFRTFFFASALGVYANVATSTPAGWLFAVPIIDTVKQTLPGLAYSLDGCSDESITEVLELIATVLRPFRPAVSLDKLLAPSLTGCEQDQFNTLSVSVAKVVIAVFGLVQQLLSIIDYICALGRGTEELTNLVVDLIRVGAAIENMPETYSFTEPSARTLSRYVGPTTNEKSPKDDMRSDLERTLGRTRYYAGKFYLSKGSTEKVVFDATDQDALREELWAAAKDFRKAVAASTTFEHIVN